MFGPKFKNGLSLQKEQAAPLTQEACERMHSRASGCLAFNGHACNHVLEDPVDKHAQDALHLFLGGRVDALEHPVVRIAITKTRGTNFALTACRKGHVLPWNTKDNTFSLSTWIVINTMRLPCGGSININVAVRV